MPVKLKKGSKEAKAYMARIRAMRNNKGIGSLPFTGEYYGVKILVQKEYDYITFKVGGYRVKYSKGDTQKKIAEEIVKALKLQSNYDEAYFEGTNYNKLVSQFSMFVGTLKDELKKIPARPKKTTTTLKSPTNQTGRSNVKKDMQLKAKAPGKRKSSTGRTYYEYRKNRTDAPGSLTGMGLSAKIGAFFDDSTIKELDQLKKEYYKLAKKYHPDAGGTKEQFQQLQNEYEKMRDAILKGSNFTAEQKSNEINIDNALKDVIDVLVNIPGIEIEVIGKWIWVNGNTYPVKSELSSAGLEFIKKAGKPYWVYKGVESSGRGKMSIDEIRAKYGTQKISPKDRKKLSGVGYIPVTIALVKRSKLKRALKKLTLAINKRPI